MKSDQILRYVCSNQSFRSFKKFLKTFCGVETLLVDLHGYIFCENDVCPKTFHCVSSVCLGSFVSGEEDPQDHESQERAAVIDRECLDKFAETLGAGLVDLSDGSRRILIPLFIKHEAIGYLLLKPGGRGGFSDEAVKSVIAFCRDFLRGLLKAELEFIECLQDNAMTHQQHVIKEVLECIHMNYHVPDLSLRDIAREKGISYHYLSRLFKREAKVSFSVYRNHYRIKKAAELLKNKRLLVSQISFHCGFEDPGYFSKAFKMSVGVSPQDYRERFTPLRKSRAFSSGAARKMQGRMHWVAQDADMENFSH